jgi:RNA polymerase sigma factor (TIGR02999 family)
MSRATLSPFGSGGDSRVGITALLRRAAQGDKAAEQQLWDLIYNDLRQIANRALSAERSTVPMQATELVNAAFVRLSKGQPIQWQDRKHFFLVSAQVIRHILVDLARYASRKKRGEQPEVTEFEEWMAFVEPNPDHVLLVHSGLSALAAKKPNGNRMQQVVTLRYFAGCTDAEIAALLGASERTVKRDWNDAKAYLEDHFRK